MIRRRLLEVDRVQESRVLLDRLERIVSLTGTILAFEPLPDEPDIAPLISRLRADGRLALVCGRGESAVIDRPGEQIVLGLIPGRVFDRRGGRLGRGGGTFDRILERSAFRRIGVAFDCQILDEVPVEPHDVRMDEVVTASERIVVAPGP